METVKFYWEKESEHGTVTKGTFTVTATTFDECMRMGKEEIEKAGADLDDWHAV